MPLQEVPNWPGRGQNVLSGHELHTDVGLDTAVAIPREFASYRKGTLLLCRFVLSGVLSIFLVTVMSLKMICGRC